MIVLDTNILIALADPDDAHHAFADALMTAHLGSVLVVNVLTFAEALVHPAAAGVAEETERRFTRMGLRVVGILESTALEIARIRHSTGLRMPHALVILTAEQLGAAVATTDARVAQIARSRGLVVHTI